MVILVALGIASATNVVRVYAADGDPIPAGVLIHAGLLAVTEVDNFPAHTATIFGGVLPADFTTTGQATIQYDAWYQTFENRACQDALHQADSRRNDKTGFFSGFTVTVTTSCQANQQPPAQSAPSVPTHSCGGPTSVTWGQWVPAGVSGIKRVVYWDSYPLVETVDVVTLQQPLWVGVTNAAPNTQVSFWRNKCGSLWAWVNTDACGQAQEDAHGGLGDGFHPQISLNNEWIPTQDCPDPPDETYPTPYSVNISVFPTLYRRDRAA